MSEARVQDLQKASKVFDNDNFLLEQMDEAKRLTGQDLIRYLMTAADNGGLWAIHIGSSQPAGTQNVWIDTATDVPTLKVRDSGTAKWISLPVITQATTKGDFEAWNLEVNHPVGSWWISDNPASPHVLFGGEWEQMKGKFLLAADGNHPASSEGGNFKITQTAEQVAPHIHTSGKSNANGTIGLIGEGPQQGFQLQFGMLSGRTDLDIRTSSAGGGEPMDITNPYHATYIWRRVR